jgi:hypothetical protein
MTEPQHAGPGTARRLVWLLVVPIASALFPWFVFSVLGARPGGLVLLLVGAVPLIGCLGALSVSFAVTARLWPLVPYAVAGALFLFLLLAAHDITNGNPLGFGPALVLAVAMPVLALAGGVVSYRWLPVPEPGWEAEGETEVGSEA